MSKDMLTRSAQPQRQSQDQARSGTNEQRVAPGKVTLTSKLTRPGSAPVQRKQAPAPSSGSQSGADMAEDWMMVALRPDLHQQPVLRTRSDIGYAHVEAHAGQPGRAAPAAATLQAKRASDPDAGHAPAHGAMDAPTSSGAPLPAELAASMEAMSGVDLSGVRVHRGSAKPASIGALAYTQGSDIHLGAGGEAHLAHEAWHVVQQAQGRVRPTMQAGGVAINDDPALEREADELGARAARGESPGQAPAPRAAATLQRKATDSVVQRVKIYKTCDGWMRYGGDSETAIEVTDTATITDPLKLFDLAMEIKEHNLALAEEIWRDYERAFVAWCQPNARVMRLDNKLQPAGRATVLRIDDRGCSIRFAKQENPVPGNRKHHNVKNVESLRFLRPLLPDEQGNDGDAYTKGDKPLLPNGDGTVALAPNTEKIMRILGVSAKVGKNIQARQAPTDEVCKLIGALDSLGWKDKKTEARSVYIQDGPWEAAESAFRKFLQPSGNPSGSPEEADRRWQVTYHGLTAILREESSAPQDIAATIELQLGDHICEYKWARTEMERRQERGRVEHWDPKAPIEQRRAGLVEELFAAPQTLELNHTSDLVGGSTGLTQQDGLLRSWEEFLGSDLCKRFKPKALEHIGQLSCPEQDKLRFVNRRFTGSRIAVGNDPGLKEMPHGLARVNEVRGYLQGKLDSNEIVDKTPYQQQLLELDRLQVAFGESRSGGGAKPDTQLLSVEALFWERFDALSAEEQIAMIDGSLPALTQVSSLAYEDKSQSGEAEPESIAHVSGYEFHIGSRHAYKFHEQSIDSHPGLAGTQKEIELALMKQALQRHLAGALPRSGAVGKMGESTNWVEVNGLRIMYLAWSPAPTSKRIYIPDYMARSAKTPDAPQDTSTGPSHSVESKLISNLELLLQGSQFVEASDLLIENLESVTAPRLLLAPVGQLFLACVKSAPMCQRLLQRIVMPLFGHVPRPLVHGTAEALGPKLDASVEMFAVYHKAAPAYALDLLAELVTIVRTPEYLTLLAKGVAGVYGHPHNVPRLALDVFCSRARALMNQDALATFFEKTGLPAPKTT